MTKIIGNNDGPGGRNESYKIGSRKNVPRTQAVKEVKEGRHSGAHVVKVNNKYYVRDNPDPSRKDNVNRGTRLRTVHSAPRAGTISRSKIVRAFKLK